VVTTIVVGVDGSPAAARATEVGLRLAASMDGQVVFMHLSPLAEKLFEEAFCRSQGFACSGKPAGL